MKKFPSRSLAVIHIWMITQRALSRSALGYNAYDTEERQDVDPVEAEFVSFRKGISIFLFLKRKLEQK